MKRHNSIKYLTISFTVLFLLSCKENMQNKNCDKWIVRSGKSDWSYGTINNVDSLSFNSPKHITIYIDGTKTEIYADWINVARTSNCN